MRRVFLCMFMFQYSPGNTVNNATGFYMLGISSIVGVCVFRIGQPLHKFKKVKYAFRINIAV